MALILLRVNYFDFGIDTEQSDIEYDADLQLVSIAALIDWFPSSRSGFHVTGGLLYNDNRVDATAQSTATLEVGGIEDDIEDELSGLGVYPVLSFGVTYQF